MPSTIHTSLNRYSLFCPVCGDNTLHRFLHDESLCIHVAYLHFEDEPFFAELNERYEDYLEQSMFTNRDGNSENNTPVSPTEVSPSITDPEMEPTPTIIGHPYFGLEMSSTDIDRVCACFPTSVLHMRILTDKRTIGPMPELVRIGFDFDVQQPQSILDWSDR